MAEAGGRAGAKPTKTKKAGKAAKRVRTNRIKAMEHPLRARVWRTLVEEGTMSPAQISRVLDADVGYISYHAKALVKLGCAELVETRPVRGAVEHFYRATDRHLIDRAEWEELNPIMGEDLLCDIVQRILDDFVVSRGADIVGSDGNFHITRTPQILDPQGLEEAMESAERHRLEMSEIEKRSVKRRAEEETPSVPVSSCVLLFKVPKRSLDT